MYDDLNAVGTCFGLLDSIIVQVDPCVGSSVNVRRVVVSVYSSIYSAVLGASFFSYDCASVETIMGIRMSRILEGSFSLNPQVDL